MTPWRFFMLRLSLAFGIPLQELEQRVSGRDLVDYYALDTIMPIGELGAYWRSAMQVWSMAAQKGDGIDMFLFPSLKAWYDGDVGMTNDERNRKISGTLSQALHAAAMAEGGDE
jgi:hypothetical protein